MCELDCPDCLNCPYEDCTASVTDIRRQWRNGYKENVDQFLREELYGKEEKDERERLY